MPYQKGTAPEMLTLRIMTLNLGGGVKNFSGEPDETTSKNEALLDLLFQLQPDVLCVQEIAQYTDAEGLKHSMVDLICNGGEYSFHCYGETLSMKHHMQVKKDLMVNGLFKDWWDWSKGNAVFSRLPFARLGDPTREGVPRNVPIFQPLRYEGTRDTDPRYVILTRLKRSPFPYLVNLHLTTLIGERGEAKEDAIVARAQQLRAEQISQVISLLSENILQKGLPLLLAGDFNANPDEPALQLGLEAEHGFVRLAPSNDIPTHPEAGAVDHIYFFPGSRLLSYSCQVVASDLAHRISDHLPVLADVVIE